MAASVHALMSSVILKTTINFLYVHCTKMKFSITISSINVTNLVTFTEKILNGKLFCAVAVKYDMRRTANHPNQHLSSKWQIYLQFINLYIMKVSLARHRGRSSRPEVIYQKGVL